MGIIKKQGIQGSIILYIGVFIGFLTSSVFFPKILSKEEIGLLATLVSYSTVFAQVSTLGFNSVIVRMFSYFRNHENKHNNFFFFVFWVIIIGSLFSILLFFAFKNIIIKINIDNSPLFVEYLYYLLPLIIFTLVFFILDTYYTVLFKTVRGILLKEVLQRFLILLALFLYYIYILNLKGFVIAYIVALSIPSIILVLTLFIEGEIVIRPKLNFVSKDLARSMFSVGLFGVLTSIVGSANVQIDKAMASSMMSLEATGIYATVLIFPLLIKIPSRALLKIASAIIAEAWKRNDLAEIKKVYHETSINQYIIGLLVFVGLWSNVENIFRILPVGYEAGRYVILFLGIAFTFEMATGASNNIIATSREYKYLTWFVAIMLVLVVISNLIFIPLYEISGVAFASAITLILFTLMKIVFIYRKFKMQPFNYKFLYITGIGAVAYVFSLIIPLFENLVLDILIRSGIITVAYVIMLIATKVSPELNAKLYQLKRRIGI